MRNLWIFIGKYNAFFLFVIFFAISLVLIFRNNPYQRASVVNSSNEVVGRLYERIANFKNYLMLREVNDSLVAENVWLRNQLKSSFVNDSVEQHTVYDSLTRQQYTYIVARVVNNSVHMKNNFLTINRGRAHGISEDMGVISSSGVVGIVREVSENYARVQSLLHTATRISASIEGNKGFGQLAWGEGTLSSQNAVLLDVGNHVVVRPGEKIVTSGLGDIFPAGIPVGRVLKSGVKGGNNFMDIEVRLATNFSTLHLHYVYVVNNLRAAEQRELEARIPEE